MACWIALLTSWRSILLTMSKVFSGMSSLFYFNQIREASPQMHITKLNGVHLFVKRKETVEVFSGLRTHLFRRELPQFGNFSGNFHDKGRFIPPAPVGHGSQERRIGFNEHAIQRNVSRNIANPLCLGKGHISREGNQETHVQRSTRMRLSAGKAMQNAS